MANIQLSELNPAGSELFADSESYLNDLSLADATVVHGGAGTNFIPYLDIGTKFLQFALTGYGVQNVVSLVGGYSNTGLAGGAGVGTDVAGTGTDVAGTGTATTIKI
jgi:hypothetical protein